MESIATLNRRLIDHYGADSDTNRPIFRIVFSDDEIEKRRVIFLENGIELLHSQVMEVKKYPYIRAMHVLERLVIVPEINKEELIELKLSYEPVWCYCNSQREAVTPTWDATKFVVDTIYAALGKKSMRKYVDDERNTTPEGRELRISELQEELFGDETETGDALRYREGIVVPNSYKKED